MSFSSLVRQLESRGKVKLRGGQCEGRVEASENVPVNRYVPTRGKGAEYAARYRLEEERNYIESCQRSAVLQGLARLDVTGGPSGSQMEQPEELTSIGTVPNLRELNSEELTQVYSRYNFDPIEPTEQLENIYSQKEQILKLIETNQVCVIKGPTGCGKSTQIPQFILDAKAAEKKHCSIVVTQPRRIAAINIAQRVCQERGWGEPGGLVGYQVGLDKKADVDTRILYCTTGVLLEKLINTKHMNDFTHVILDEVHEREEDMDFLMLIVRKFLRSNSPQVKVVLMSATINTTRFAEYFSVVIRKKLEPTVTYTITTQKKFSVQMHYINDLETLGLVPPPSEEEPGISEEAYLLVPLMLRAFNNIDAADYANKRSNEKRGAVLIFLPGIHQIEYLHEKLHEADEEQKKVKDCPNPLNLWLCPLHSTITKDEQEKVSNFAPPGMRKVILSTNIAESSLTIPDVKYVIDFCLTKHLVADPNTGFTCLKMAWASHTNCIQREGRVGRVQDGRVYRMVPKGFYEFKMSSESVPEMLRCPLDMIVLKCKRLVEEECPLRLISTAIDPPDLTNYEKTILKLKEIGALLVTCRGEMTDQDGDLTFLGRVMGSLPLDIHVTKLIMLGHIFDILEETIIMGCAMTVRNLFMEPFKQRLESYNNKLLWADLSESDAIAFLNAYTVWRQLTGLGKFEKRRTDEYNWTRSFLLQVKHLKDMAQLEEEIKKRLRYFNIQLTRFKNKPLWNNKEKPLILKLALAGAFYPNYYSCNSQNPNAEIEAVKMLGNHSPFQCVYLQNMAQPAPLYADQVKKMFHENQISDDIEIISDSSQKLIIEFRHNTRTEKMVGNQKLFAEIPGNILMPVYRAVKMRQLGTQLTLRLYSNSEAQEQMNAYILKTTSSRLSSSAQMSEYKPVIPWDQQLVEMSVCHVEDAGNFYALLFPLGQEKLHKVDKLLNDFNLLCELSGEVEEGAVYAAPYKDEGEDTNRYYRAQVIRRYRENNGRRLYVDLFFIDYGNKEMKKDASELREIVNEEAQREIDKIPPLAVKCVLAEVAPSVWNHKVGHWSEEATAFVKKTLIPIETENLWPTQVYSYVNGVAHVYVFLEEEGRDGRPPPTLNKILIEKRYAKAKEEDYLSQRNHAKREEIARGEQVIDSIEDDSVFKKMNKDMLSLPFSQGRTRVLRGPHSPLEMKLYSKIKSSSQKEVRVEWNSVNSVLLDSEPSEPYERLLVAGYVSQSAEGHRLTLNHTTVLPNLNGLAALVCLLFAPSVELRRDECKSRYIGALCGLGSDPETGQVLYPENDMEIRFDMEINNDDLISINKLRYIFNERFCSEHSDDLPEQTLFTFRANLKSILIELLSAERNPVKVEHCRFPYRWNLVEEDSLLRPYEEEDVVNSPSIYNLFCAIDLQPNRDYHYIKDLVNKINTLMELVYKDLPPKELKCDLCDVDFMYWVLLRQHVGMGHHKRLLRWLKTRAAAHGLTVNDKPTPAPPPAAPAPTRPARPTRPAVRQPNNRC